MMLNGYNQTEWFNGVDHDTPPVGKPEAPQITAENLDKLEGGINNALGYENKSALVSKGEPDCCFTVYINSTDGSDYPWYWVDQSDYADTGTVYCGQFIQVSGSKGWQRGGVTELNPEMYGSAGVYDATVDDTGFLQKMAVDAAVGLKKIVGCGHYRVTDTINLRHLDFDFSKARFELDHANIGIIAGGNSNNPNNPDQKLGAHYRDADHTSTAHKEIRLIGSRNQNVSLQGADRVEVYADIDDAQGANCAYSTYDFKYALRIYLTTNENRIELTGDQWINENTFNLKVAREVYIEGDYHHNNNIFNEGTFEGDGIIRITNGRMNHFRNVRAEGSMAEISFSDEAEGNTVTGSWWGSGIRVSGPELKANVIDDGSFNIVKMNHEVMAPLMPICGFNNDSLLESPTTSGEYNIKNIGNVTINANDFSIPNFNVFYESGKLPVKPLSDLFVFEAGGVVSGGFRVQVQGFDSSGNPITTTGDDIVITSVVGSAGFNTNVPSVNTSNLIYMHVKNLNTAYINLLVLSGGSGLVARDWSFSVYSNDSRRGARMANIGCAPNIL